MNDNVYLKRAYAEGVRRALNEELTKEGSITSAIGGIPKAVRGGLWGAGIGGAHGAVTGDTEDDILRGALTGGLIGTGVGYGSRHLSKRLRDATRSAPGEMWRARGTPEARELALGNVGKTYERLMKDPAEFASLGQSLKSMGLLGVGGGIAARPLYDRMQNRRAPAYNQLYQYYLQNASRGMR
ncbi:MAG: hypothetical protein DRJ03_01825 [Chloroflexi bacterium]|nr:MAG: hypothetical protein DRJ03_01825 [Chloroflexota bacterium]